MYMYMYYKVKNVLFLPLIRIYSSQCHFHRILCLISNEVASKAQDLVGDDPLVDPDDAVINLRLALRVCASFRGCYLDHKEKASAVVNQHNELIKQQRQQHQESQIYTRCFTHTLHSYLCWDYIIYAMCANCA